LFQLPNWPPLTKIANGHIDFMDGHHVSHALSKTARVV